MLCKGFLLLMYFSVCESVCMCVCVHLRPPAPHHQDTGLNEGSYSPFPTLLSQQVAHNVLFSLHKLLAFLLFLCSYLFISPPLCSHTLSRSLYSFSPDSDQACFFPWNPLTSFFFLFLSSSLWEVALRPFTSTFWASKGQNHWDPNWASAATF